MDTGLKSQFSFEATQVFAKPRSIKGQGYIIEPGLYEAVRLALLLNQPLLLTGKPGTGKTELAFKLAGDLHKAYPESYLPTALKFNTKTTSSFTDLFYSYDALGHFHAANFGNFKDHDPDARKFIQLQALGQAIVLSNKERPSGYGHMPGIDTKLAVDSREFSSVVLIDEVDKAPRDFTNDLLNELENIEFTVKEDKNTRYTTGQGKILLILTSNSEKNLPDAFLRRCLFYHIDYPGPKLLEKIVFRKLFPDINMVTPSLEDNLTLAAFNTYLTYFQALRNRNLKKEPATAELISWIFYLRKKIEDGVHWENVDTATRIASLSIIAKHSEDYQLLKNELPAI
jgi:MoxR-like ATPase